MKPTVSILGAKLALAILVPAFAASSAAQSSEDFANKQGARRVVLVSIEDRRLAVLENGKVLAYFSVAVGADVSPSPIGDFEIVRRVANPTYYHDGVVMPAGKDNPVGTRWMGLNVRGYGIHGTNSPRSVGHASSHGCIRLRNRDVEKLYAMLRMGDIVQIRGERDEEIAAVFGGAPDVVAVHGSEAAGGQ
ncbi:MAG: L,D-transpeptidase [Candidatus Sulfotelmatobacter sp.]|jgi:lipoprotein-anchoring transpeptidase ErfK/SrfK